MKTIDFVNDFTDTPGGRYRAHGDFSGEQFRDELLEPALRANEKVVLNLNGVFGFPPSFIDEAFGKLVDHLGLRTVQNRLTIELSDDASTMAKIKAAFEEHGKANPG